MAAKPSFGRATMVRERDAGIAGEAVDDLAAQPRFAWRARMLRPTRQYNRTNSRFTDTDAWSCAERISALSFASHGPYRPVWA
jgi:hypothetical protein